MKKQTFFKLSLICIILPFALACKKAKKGCTDIKALNMSYEAETNDGSCQYSKVAFYASASFFQTLPITKVEVSINGNFIGTTSAVYPSGPGNCSAPGTVSYQFTNGAQVDWGAKITLSNGAILLSNGVVSPSSNAPCLAVNVTR